MPSASGRLWEVRLWESIFCARLICRRFGVLSRMYKSISKQIRCYIFLVVTKMFELSNITQQKNFQDDGGTENSMRVLYELPSKIHIFRWIAANVRHSMSQFASAVRSNHVPISRSIQRHVKRFQTLVCPLLRQRFSCTEMQRQSSSVPAKVVSDCWRSISLWRTCKNGASLALSELN